MRAIVFDIYGGLEVASLRNVPKPLPKANEVLIKVHATSINDWDPTLIKGKPYIIRLFGGLFKPKNTIPGVDVAGVIEAVGENVQEYAVGDAVFGDLSESGFGAFAEYVCTTEDSIIKKPESMSFEDAAAIPHAAMLAWQGLIEEGDIQSGQKVLINGAGGGVGTQGIHLAKRYEVEITAVDSAPKLDLLRKLGYDEVIDYRQKDFTIDQDKYDLVLDVKSNRPVSSYARCLKPGGKYVTVGGSMGRILEVATLGALIGRLQKKQLKVLSLAPNKDLSAIIQLYEAGKFKPYIDGVHSLEQVPELLQYFSEGKHQGKIIIKL